MKLKQKTAIFLSMLLIIQLTATAGTYGGIVLPAPEGAEVLELETADDLEGWGYVVDLLDTDLFGIADDSLTVDDEMEIIDDDLILDEDDGYEEETEKETTNASPSDADKDLEGDIDQDMEEESAGENKETGKATGSDAEKEKESNAEYFHLENNQKAEAKKAKPKTVRNTIDPMPDRKPFSKLEIRTGNKQNENITVEDDGLVFMSFSLELNNDYLAGELDKLLEQHPDIGEDELEELVSTSPDLPKISFTTTIAGGLFALDKLPPDGDLNTGSDEKIGRYTVKATDDGQNIRVECKLDNLVYNRFDVSAFETFQLELKDKAAAVGKYPVIMPGDLGVNIKIKLVGDPMDPTDEKQNYTIKKEGPAKADSPSIDYTITAEVVNETDPDSNGDLITKYISDAVPDGLELVGAETKVWYGSKTGTPLTDTASISGDSAGVNWQLSKDKKTVIFKVPEGSVTGEKAVKAEMTVKTCLSKERYQQYILGKSQSWPIKNEAYLQKNPGKDTIKKAEKEIDKGEPFFVKEGKSKELGGREWEWTLKLNPHFTSATDVFLVDYISDSSVHKYKPEEAQVDQNGVSDQVIFDVLTEAQVKAILFPDGTSENTSYYYENIIKNGEAGSALAVKLTADHPSGIVYTYESGGKTRQMFLLPADKYMHEPFTVRYNTELNTSSDDGSGDKKNLENKASVVWKEVVYGPGPGTRLPSPNGIDIGESVTANYKVLDKTGGSYDEKTQRLNWIFTVNRNGKDLGSFDIFDEFDVGKYELLLSESSTVSVKKLDRITGLETNTVMLSHSADNTATGNWFHIDSTSAAEKAKIQVHFDNVAAADCYEFSIPVKVVDPEILKKQDTFAGTVSNTAAYQYPGGPASPDTVTAEKKIANTWITKKAVPVDQADAMYDYQNHRVKWSVTINPNHIPLTAATLTDTLPEQTNFDLWEKVMRIDESGQETAGMITGHTAEFSDGLKIELEPAERTVKFVFPQNFTDTDSFRFEFTTVVSPEIRRQWLIDMEGGKRRY